jgi:hypothetical protein
VCVPIELGTNVDEHVDSPGVAVATSVQLAGMNVPLPLVLKLTVPVGAVFVPPDVSSTVAVQMVASFTATVSGAQVTVVDVDRFATVTVADPVLVSCVASPL